jgi:hypothetical protein
VREAQLEAQEIVAPEERFGALAGRPGSMTNLLELDGR